jgi:hypothetical protein
MSTGMLPETRHLVLAASFVLAWGSTAVAQTSTDRRIEAGFGPPIQELQPLFPHIGLAVLQDIKELENRPEGTRDEWAQALRRRYGSLFDRRRALLSLSDEVVGRGGSHLSGDEWEVRTGGVQRRLIGLAITGRISKAEYDTFVRRLQGN